jgi:hypothetical protein
MAITDRGRMADGITVLNGGMDSGRAPSMLSTNQCAYAGNVTFRGGYAKTRPGFKRVSLATSAAATAFSGGRFQGATHFDYSTGQLVAMVGGNSYKLTPPSSGSDWDVTDITNTKTMSVSRERVHYCQVEGYLICQDGTRLPLIWDGSSMDRSSGDQVPIGTGPMAYGQGRLWVAQGRNFVAGDILGGGSTPVPAVLNFTENSYLAGGGAFTVPTGGGNITSMRFMAAPNTALGQGELAVFTANAAYSVVVPPDRYDWFAVADPIQRVMLIHNGALSHFSTELVNGDVYFRSRDGIRSVVQAVRDFQTLGNTPLSREMYRVLKYDEPKYLGYTSGVLFDNRYLLTAQSDHDDDTGIGFKGLIALDFDLISGMSGKTPPAYDGFWTLDVTRDSVEDSLSFLQLVKGDFESVERCFAFMRNADGDTELWELTLDGDEIEDTDKKKTSFTGGESTASSATLTMPAIHANGMLANSTAVTLSGLHASESTYNATTIYYVKNSTPPDRHMTLYDDVGLATPAGTFSEADSSITVTTTASTNVANKITSELETPSFNFKEIGAAKILEGGDLWVDEVSGGTVTFHADFHPDQYPCWVSWQDWSVIAEYQSDDCESLVDYMKQYRPRMRLGMPTDAEEPATGKPFNYGWEFAARLKWTGHARVKLFRMNARATEEEPYADVNIDSTSKAIACDCLGGVSSITNQ